VTDTLPSDLIYHSVTASSGSYGEDSGVITWTGSVDPSSVVTITCGVTVSEEAPAGAIVNSAVISGGGEIFTRTVSVNVVPPIYLPIIFRNYCPPLYFDDFSDPDSGWSIADYEYSRYEYVDGEYQILRKDAGWSGARPWADNDPDFLGYNYIVAADVRNDTGVYGSYGLLFGMSNDWTQFYTFEIYPNGNFEIWRGGYNTPATMLSSGSSGYINTGTASNRLKVKRNGSLIEVYANNRLLRTVSDSRYTGLTQVGLINSSYGDWVDIRFDNFTVYSAACDATTVMDLGGQSTETDPNGGWAEGFDRKGE
jgi:hypothetical protein